MPLPMRVLARTIMRPGLVATLLERNAEWLLDRVLSDKNEKAHRFIEQSVTRPDPRFVGDLARVMCAMRRDLTSRHLLDDVGRITAPTLVIWGGSDRLLPLRPVAAWVDKLPAGELEVIERCGHMPIIENPEAVVSRMIKFLRPDTRLATAVG